MRALSIWAGWSRTASEMRSPAAEHTLRIVRCLSSGTLARNRWTSSRLSTTGKVWGFLGAGMRSVTGQSRWRVTLYRNRRAATAMVIEPGASCRSVVR